jgi:hypothetical protein
VYSVELKSAISSLPEEPNETTIGGSKAKPGKFSFQKPNLSTTASTQLAATPAPSSTSAVGIRSETSNPRRTKQFLTIQNSSPASINSITLYIGDYSTKSNIFAKDVQKSVLYLKAEGSIMIDLMIDSIVIIECQQVSKMELSILLLTQQGIWPSIVADTQLFSITRHTAITFFGHHRELELFVICWSGGFGFECQGFRFPTWGFVAELESLGWRSYRYTTEFR